jgi:hypothetical protein
MPFAGTIRAATVKQHTLFRPKLYLVILLCSAVVPFAYQVRTHGVFACPAAGYGPQSYLADCEADSFGDYDHGAFWFGMEPEAEQAAVDAEALFVGNSRMQFALSTKATTDWSQSQSIRHYLLGFAHTQNMAFFSPLLAKLKPRAKVYVINVDQFFDLTERHLIREILHEEASARVRYVTKHRWLLPHRTICGTLPILCGDRPTVFRARGDGSFHLFGSGPFAAADVADGADADSNRWEQYSRLAERFIAELPVDRGCVVLTVVPYRGTRRAEARAIAQTLDLDLVEPNVTGLRTFDGSHLDPASAERWSAAFFSTVGSRIRQCVAEGLDLTPANSGPR